MQHIVSALDKHGIKMKKLDQVTKGKRIIGHLWKFILIRPHDKFVMRWVKLNFNYLRIRRGLRLLRALYEILVEKVKINF